jgi:hypothetical protein
MDCFTMRLRGDFFAALVDMVADMRPKFSKLQQGELDA